MRLIIALAVLMLLYSIQSRLYREYWNIGLRIRLTFSKDTANIGEQIVLTQVIENRKALPLPILHVKFRTTRTFSFEDNENTQTTDYHYRNDVFSVLGKQKVTRQLPFLVTHRGYFSINELHLTSRDLFLTKSFVSILPNDTAIYVLPERLQAKHFASMHEQMLGDFHTHRQSMEDPFAFAGIRPYQTFDTMKSINWKSTAHMGMLMVNQYQPATSNEVRIFLNLTPYMQSYADGLFEHAINIANTVGSAFIDDAIDVSLQTNAYDILTKEQSYLAPGHGKEHKLTLARMLSRIDLKQKCSDFMELVRNSIKKENHPVSYILISTYRDDALLSLFERFAAKDNMYWIIPEYSYANIHYTNQRIMKWEV